MMQRKTWFSPFSMLALSAMAIYAGGCATGTRGEEGRAMRLEPTSEKAVKRDIVGYARLGGKLYTPPASQAVVTPPYNAPVEQVFVTVGRRVGRGTVLMDLEFAEAEASYEAAGDATRQADAALNTARQQYLAPVREAQRALEQAQSTERTLRSQTNPNGDASALVQATEARRQAEQAVRQAQAEYKQNLQPFQEQADAARRGFRQSRSSAKQSQIHSPIAGTILELNAKPGQVVGQDKNERLAVIVDLDDLQVHAPVSDESAPYLKERTPVVITFTGLPDQTFEGWVVGVRSLPERDGDGVRREAVIGFRNTQGLVKPGAEINAVSVQTGRADDVLAVPADAIDRDDTGKPYVRVLKGQEWQVRIVEPGLSDGKYTQIKSGVQEGETVQVTPGD